MSDINQLRSHLFQAIDGLKDGSLPIDKALAIRDVAQAIINSAKVEVDYMKVSGNTLVSSGFIPAQNGRSSVTPTMTGMKKTEQLPGGSVTTHKMR